MNWSNRFTIAPESESRHITCQKTEEAALKFVRQFGDAEHISQIYRASNYDIERLGWKIDVKGKERTVDGRPEFSANTWLYQCEFDCDIYLFASYNAKTGSAQLMGWEWKVDYLQMADFVRAGVMHDGRKQLADGHKTQYKKLQPMEELGKVMSGQFWLVRDKEQLDERLGFFRQWLLTEWDWSSAVQWEPKRFIPKRSLSQNALFHVWCREMADHFSGKGADVTEDQMKDLMKYKFLGTEDRVIGKTVISGQIRETSSLDRGEMMSFMDEVQSWALDHGVKLTCPIDSEYMKLRASSGG